MHSVLIATGIRHFRIPTLTMVSISVFTSNLNMSLRTLKRVIIVIGTAILPNHGLKYAFKLNRRTARWLLIHFISNDQYSQ